MRPNHLAPLALALLLSADAAVAADFCVDTSAELQSALAAAAVNGEDDVIRVEPGSYPVPAGGFLYDGTLENHNLVLSGGWRTIGLPPNVLPCFLRDRIDPRRTQIHGGATVGNMTLRAGGHFALVLVEGIMFAGGHATGNQTAGGLYIDGGDGVIVRYDLFVGNEAEQTGGLFVSSNSSVEVVENLFVGNNSAVSRGAMVLVGTHGWITHNGFASNSGPSAAVYLLPTSSQSFVLTSNLFWDNAATGLDFASGFQFGHPLLNDNLVQDLALIQGDIDPASSGNFDADPLFSPPGECDRELGYELGQGSPAVDTASANPPHGLPDQDLIGRERVVGAAPDIGPFERRIVFCDGVEGGNFAGWSVVQP
jgi:hypothetical protein